MTALNSDQSGTGTILPLSAISIITICLGYWIANGRTATLRNSWLDFQNENYSTFVIWCSPPPAVAFTTWRTAAAAATVRSEPQEFQTQVWVNTEWEKLVYSTTTLDSFSTPWKYNTCCARLYGSAIFYVQYKFYFMWSTDQLT